MNKYTLSFIGALFLLSGSLAAQSADAERLENMVTVLASDDFKGRGFGTKDGLRAAQYISEKFQESGIQPIWPEGYLHPFDYRNGILNIRGNNVVGIVRSEDPELSNEYIILGAHYDHLGWKLEGTDTVVYNGADDNASGVAAITEIGRIINENKEWLGRSVIIIAFDGEESGLIGSNAFVSEKMLSEEPLVDSESIVAMINLDMVGMYEAHGGVDLLGWDLLENADQIFKNANTDSPIKVVKTTGTIPNRTDTTPFGEIGIPAIHVFTDTESPYHKPEDDSDLLDYEGMAIITDFVATVIQDMSTLPELPKSKEMQKIAEQGSMKYFNPGFTLNVGGSHFDYKDYYAKAKGTFAYAAGLSFETRITQWLAIQPEVLYEWGGSQVEGGSLHTHALTVPVSLLLTTPDEGMGVRVYYQLGGYYSYAFAGKDMNGDLDFEADYNDTDYGLVFGVGMEIMHVRIGYVFQNSLIDFTNGDALDTRVKGSFFKIGWVF